MFDWLSKKSKKQERDIEKVIFDIAEYKREEDFEDLYRLLSGMEVFLPVDPDSLPKGLAPGSKYMTGQGDNVKIKKVYGPNNLPMVFVATQYNHPSLKNGYIGMKWVDVLIMMTKLNEAHGILVQGKTSWVGLDEQRVRYLLDKTK